ncbi:MAG: response regulator [Rickettsiales bacterium]|nr:response regulator [Rickettsiales bacterium]
MTNYKTVLIVEDDKILAESLSKSFVKRSYEARAVNSNKEAIEILTSFHPRYAVIDLKIAGESGLDLIKAIHEFDDSIKIVILTGYASITTTIEAIKLGACYYLAKPANVDMIIDAFDGRVQNQPSQISAKKTSIKNVEWEYINQALLDADFNVSKAARTLGMHRRTLARKLEKRKFIS